jgi:uncharacterized membrane protein
MEIILLLLVVVGVLFLLPIAAIIKASNTSQRVARLVERVQDLEHSRQRLAESLRRAEQDLAELQARVAIAAIAAEARAERAAPSAPVVTEPPPPARPFTEPALLAERSREASPVEPAKVLVAVPFGAVMAPPPAANALPPARVPSDAPPDDAPPPDAPAAEASPAAAPRSPQTQTSPPLPPTPKAAPAAPPSFDWERWVGVRGAAVLGGVVLALAAISFFRYAVDQGLLPPPVRVAIGALLGVSCLLAGERLRPRYEVTANALCGGGLVILYAAFWAARVLYELIGMEVAFGLMALTTAAGCLLAVRYGSLVIAVLGLLGGFATPLLLSTGSDRPIGLFGYILLLDTGFILAARRRGWSLLMSLALGCTLLIEGLWVVTRMGPERTWLGMAVVALFSVVFVLAGARPPTDQRGAWLRNQVAALVLPFGFALYFASQAQGVPLTPMALLSGLLAFGAGWLARREPTLAWLPKSAAIASVTVVGVWLWGAALTRRECWEVALASSGLSAVFQLRSELDGGEAIARRPAAIAALGFFSLLIWTAAVGNGPAELWPWLTAWTISSALLTLASRFEGQATLVVAASALSATGMAAFGATHQLDAELLGMPALVAIELAVALAWSALSLARRLRVDHVAAVVFPALILLALSLPQHLSWASTPSLSLGVAWALGALALFAATRCADGRVIAAAALPLAFAQHARVVGVPFDAEAARQVFGLLAGTALFVSAWPLAVHGRVPQPRWAFYTSALAGPLWFLPLRHSYVRAFGTDTIGILPVALGALSIAILWYARRVASLTPDVRRSALAWYAAVALGFISVAVPLQLDLQWITIGWALESAAVLYLFRRLDHAGLKWLGLGLAFVVTVRLVVNPSVLGYHERGELPFLNWLLYTYWVPAVALSSGHLSLRDLEVQRQRRWEQELCKGAPAGALGLGLAVVAILFVWLNLSIFDAFGEGSALVVDFERRPTRDLVLSLSWAAYAGVLLGLGMAKSSRALRWLSLVLFILTIGKVFLYDLGNLEDLYQVLSLLGLAVSLITVSLAYQRFVFGKVASERAA